MADVYEHLRIEKERLINDRRKIDRKIPRVIRGNPRAHGQYLGEALAAATERARAQPGAEDGRVILKLNYSGNLDFRNIK